MLEDELKQIAGRCKGTTQAGVRDRQPKKGKKGETEKNRRGVKCGRVGVVIIIIKSRQI
jgi:hypothetical protein